MSVRDVPRGLTIWLTGLSSSGKTTIAAAVRDRLIQRGFAVEWLDGDAVRETFSRGLGFTRPDRMENVNRIAFVAEILTRNGIIAIVSAASPDREGRDLARQRIGQYVEVFVDAPLCICEQRDTHQIYSRARRGELRDVAGIDTDYEPSLFIDVHCRTAEDTVDQCVAQVVRSVEDRLQVMT